MKLALQAIIDLQRRKADYRFVKIDPAEIPMESLFNRFWRSAPNDVLDIQRFSGRNAGMAEKPKDEGIPYETHLDLIERELNAALKNIEEMRSKQSEAKARFQVLKTAMGAARHHLRELEDSLWPD